MNPLPGGAPQHIGLLVADIDATFRSLGAGLGLRVTEPVDADFGPEVIDHGSPGQTRVMFAELGTMLVEIIQPRGIVPTVWSQALETRGPGLHHIAYAKIDDLDEQVAQFQQADFDLTTAGHFGPSVRWCYLEQEGFVIELIDGTGPQFPVRKK